MSFILDALKKSETDRQQKAAPGIADVPTAPRSSKPSRWVPVVAALLGVNAIALVVIMLRPDELPVATPPVSADTAGGAAVAGDDVAFARAAPAKPPMQRMPDTTADAAPATEAVAVQPRPATAPDPAPAAPDAGALSGKTSGDSADEATYLTFNDVRASGGINLPDLHIDLHVYSDNPAERFVFINMNQYRENATMAEGPRLRRITAEGVILEYQGSSFLLPRE
jgi:general secretion pathway protein B